MKGRFTISPFLTDHLDRYAISLTLIFLVLCPFHNARAVDNTTDYAASTTNWTASTPNTPLAISDQHQRVGLLVEYLRKEGPGWAPGLPSALRDPQGWALHGLHGMGERLGLGSSDEDDNIDRGMFGSLFSPLSSLMNCARTEQAQALWLSPDYHHKGFLPIDDTMIFGFSMRESLLQERLRFELHPYYGQNMISQRGYYGSQASIDVRASIGPLQGGRIAMGYVNGDNALMDHGHGFDLHSELRFDNSLSLHAGVRENEETQLGNYVLLRWKLFSN